MNWASPDDRPLLVAIAGPNGAGKTTFYHSHIEPAGLRLVSADRIASQLDVDSYSAAKVATNLRDELVRQRESFAYETVFSDPVGDKLGFFQQAVADDYAVVLCFIGLSSAKLTSQRVAMRVSQGGHDVPADKQKSRYPRVMANLKSAIATLPHVIVFDNSDLDQPYRRVAVFENGTATQLAKPVPTWLRNLL